MYAAPNVRKPGLEEVQRLAESEDLGIAEDDIKQYHESLCGMLESYQVLEQYVEPVLPVKYPRTPGYRPSGEENKYNAWYYKSEITGAKEGPLKGYKIVIKDSFPVAGVPMMHGSRVVEGYVPDYDPTAVTRVLDAGGTIVGKAVCEDFCYSGSSFTSHPAPVLNPHNPEYATGGSSSGCAVLVQLGETDMAVGGDQGGSLRMPAAWTGVVGFKPTYGLVPYTGMGALAPAVDHCGPMAKTVQNCALLLEVIAGDDGGKDMRQRNIPKSSDLPNYSKQLSGDVKGKRIGILTEGFDNSESDVAEIVKTVACKVRDIGATVEEVSIPIHKHGVALWAPSCTEGCYHSMLNGQGHCVGPPSYYATSAIDNYHAYMSTRRKDCSATVKVTHLCGKYIFDNYGLHFYAKSQNLLALATEKYDEALKQYDALVMPTIKFKPTKIPEAGLSAGGVIKCALSMVANTAVFNGTGHPAISINAGFSEGLPVGMMLVGKTMDDANLLNIAYAYEQLLLKAAK